MIAEHQDLNGIFVVWDVPAEGALRATRTAKKQFSHYDNGFGYERRLGNCTGWTY